MNLEALLVFQDEEESSIELDRFLYAWMYSDWFMFIRDEDEYFFGSAKKVKEEMSQIIYKGNGGEL